MNFLSPWFLAGAALIAGPVIAHLIRRATRDRVSFSALQFLQPSPPRRDRRNRIQHPWLLALRCLIVAVLAAGFARPFLPDGSPLPAAEAAPEMTVVVLDESGSMQRTEVWSQAVARVVAEARKMKPIDQLAVVAVSARAEVLVTPEQWLQAGDAERVQRVAASLAGRQPTSGPTHLDLGVEAAIDLVRDQEEAGVAVARRRIVVVSDFSAGARVSGLAGKEWPRNCVVTLAAIEPRSHANLSLQWVGWTTEAGREPAPRVRIGRSPDAIAVEAHVRVRDAVTGRDLRARERVSVAAQDAQLVTLPLGAGEKLPPAVRIELEGDAETFDNRVWAVRPQSRSLRLLYAGTHAAGDAAAPRFYLERALVGLRDPAVQLTAVPTDGMLPPAIAGSPDVVVVTEPLSESMAAEMRARVEAGAFALVLVRSAEGASTAGRLAGESGWAAAAPAGSDARLAQVDLNHPLFQPFADPRYSDFSRIRFWKAQAILLPAGSRAAVAARFENDQPAVVEVPVGRGRVVVWGGDWVPQAGQWVLSSKFVPWLQNLMERAAGGPPRPFMAEVGNARLLATSPEASWRPADDAGAPWEKVEPTAAGVYEMTEYGQTKQVALQMPAGESRTDVLSLESWEQLGVPLRGEARVAARPEEARARQQAALDAEAEQKLWRWLLVAAAALLAVESLASLRATSVASAPVEGRVAG